MDRDWRSVSRRQSSRQAPERSPQTGTNYPRRAMEPDGTLEPASLVDLSLRRLHAEILSGVLPPGERLIEEQLTQRFGISRAPLREALRQLAQQGLIEHLPRRGVRVAELSATDADELFG